MAVPAATPGEDYQERGAYTVGEQVLDVDAVATPGVALANAVQHREQELVPGRDDTVAA
jgi:hypothetical protein